MDTHLPIVPVRTQPEGLTNLLAHKIQIPDLLAVHLDRSDIVLRYLAQHAVVCLVAPAGYGKSLAMSAASHVLSSNRKVLWYQCDRFDDSAERLVDHWRQIFHLAVPDLARHVMSQPHDARGLPQMPERQLIELLDTLAASDHQFTIFIDDVHLILDDDCHEILILLLRYRPACLQIVIAGRYLPFALGRQVLMPEFAYIESSELTFSEDEIRQWLQRQQAVLADDKIPLLLRCTEGWPAGLALWLMAWRCSGMPVVWSAELSITEMSDYLQGEVLNQLPTSLRKNLCIAALLGTFNEALLDSVCHSHSVHDDISRMLSLRLYIKEIPGRREWYIIHPLVAHCLVRQLSNTERRRIHAEAYRWFSHIGEMMPALAHACQASMENEAADWLKHEVEEVLANLDTAGLLLCFSRLSDDQLYSSVSLMQIACWTYLLAHRLEPAEALIQRLSLNKECSEFELAALQGYLAGLRGQLSHAKGLCQGALDALPQERFSARFFVASMLSFLSLANNDPDGARLWNRYALGVARKYRQPALEAMAHLDHGRIEFNRGHVSRCLDVLQQGFVVLQNHKDYEHCFVYGRLLVLQTAVNWVTGDINTDFDERITSALTICEEQQDVAVVYGYAIRALYLMGKGAHSLALSVLDKGESLLQARQVHSSGYIWLHTVRANIWISQGKFRRANDCLDSLMKDATASGVASCEHVSLLPGFTLLTFARLQLMTAQYKACLTLTDNWLQSAPQGFMSVFVRLVRAGALVLLQQTSESMRQVEIVRQIFLKEGISHKLQNWLPDLASFLQLPEIAEAPMAVKMVALSDREKEVLHLMAQGMTNQAIAESLFISLHTVKTHARKVNVKLGTRSRTQAIYRAKELMII